MKKLKIIIFASFCLWILGSVVLFNERNGKVIIASTAVIIIAGLFSQVSSYKKSKYDKGS